MFNKFSEKLVSSGSGGTGVPNGGLTDQHLAKASAIDGDVIWVDPPSDTGIPAGGTIGQALVKIDSTDFNADWETIVGVPPGGLAGQHLAKVSAADGDVTWEDPPATGGIPAGGSTGQALLKIDGTDYNADWETVSGVPPGGTTAQVLTKIDGTDFNVDWEDVPPGIPAGGTTGQALLKISGADYNASWYDVVTGLGSGVPAGGTTGQHLAKQSGTDGDVIWEDPPTFSLGPVIPNAVVLGDTSSTVTSLASLGTTATVLHGNAAGAPSWGAVDLASEVTGNLSVSHLDSGSSATSDTFWRGDGSWAEPPSIGTSTNVSVSSANYIQNSSFQVRNRATQSSMDLENGTVTFVADRWSVFTYADNIRSIIDSSNAQDCLTIKRYAGSSDNSIQIIQIFDTEDSLKLLNHTWVVSFEVKAKAVLLGVDSFDAFVTSGEDVDGSLADYLSYSWTNGTIQGSSVTQYAINPTWTYFQFQFNLDSSSYPDIKQLAMEFQFFFAASSPDATNDELSIRNVIWSSRYADTRAETKSLAVIKRECNRYHQNLDLYLTDAIINIPINMREIPTITLDPADSFTSANTSKDVLVIQLDSSTDNGMHTVYLDCEL